MNKPAAIYARVSSDRQKENHTIASQTVALIEYAQTHEYSVPPEWIFQDEGYRSRSGPAWFGGPARSGRRGTDRGGADLLTGPAEPKVCLSGFIE